MTTVAQPAYPYITQTLSRLLFLRLVLFHTHLDRSSNSFLFAHLFVFTVLGARYSRATMLNLAARRPLSRATSSKLAPSATSYIAVQTRLASDNREKQGH